MSNLEKTVRKIFLTKKCHWLVQIFEPHGLLPLLEMNGKENLWKQSQNYTKYNKLWCNLVKNSACGWQSSAEVCDT